MPAKTSDRLRVILCGRYHEFTNWCREHQLNPRDRNLVCITRQSHDEMRLRSVELESFEQVQVIGTFWYGETEHERRVAREIAQVANSRVRGKRMIRFEGDGRGHMYFAQMVADSLNGVTDDRLSTIHIRLPWYITPELLRHRQFSFSSRSTRAVPVKIMLDEVRQRPCLPLSWGKNQRGMQAGDEFPDDMCHAFDKQVVALSGHTAASVELLEKAGVHKQNANKYFMPFLMCDILVSSTRWANFLTLRMHKDAAPEMQLVAGLVADCLVNSTPVLRYPGEWHTPYIDDLNLAERETGWRVSWDDRRLLYCSAARVARVSVVNWEDGLADWNKDLSLGEKLKDSRPVHASPFEHVAQAREKGEKPSGNFDAGWAQLRSMLPMNVSDDFVYKGVRIR